MLQDQQKEDKKLRLNSGKYTTVICLSTKQKCLQLSNRCEGKQTIYWSKIRHSDLQTSIQNLFEKIESLYDYICENSEEVEIEKNLVTIHLRFLKQTKELRIKLHPMTMCSQEEIDSLHRKVLQLQKINQNLNINRQGMKKLTFRLQPKSLNLETYMMINFNQIKHFGRNKPLNILKLNEQHQLPKNGIWVFYILLVDVIPQPFSKSQELISPFIEIGIKNDEGQKQTIKLNISVDGEKELEETQGVTGSKNDLLCVLLNMDLKKLTVQKKFQKGQKHLFWGNFKSSDKLWPHLALYRLHITTDLFLDEQQDEWSEKEEPKTENNEQVKEVDSDT